jgi:hypothetical protein
VSLDLVRLHADFPDVDPEPLSRPLGETAYRLHLPSLEVERRFEWAELRLPKGFPDNALAKIALSPDAILRIPHIEAGGYLCIQDDPGPDSGLSPNDRVLTLLIAYQETFLVPWRKGELDDDFEKEPLNYWYIFCEQQQKATDPIRRVYTVDGRSHAPRVRESTLLVPRRLVVAGDHSAPEVSPFLKTLSDQNAQHKIVKIAEIPIVSPLTPHNWPSSEEDLDAELQRHLNGKEYASFFKPVRRKVRSHRIVIFRHPSYAFAYLMPGGPPTKLNENDNRKTYPARSTILPLPVYRFDSQWTVGRDQHPEVASRQNQHIVVLGAGALGSTVVEHLAKAGVGRITLVDHDSFETENIGRHSLGGESVGQKKAFAIAARLNRSYPSCRIMPETIKAQHWLNQHPLRGVDLLMDLTGEPEVRWKVDQARARNDCSCLVAWMEPFVAAAHVCCLPCGTQWHQGNQDSLRQLEAVNWPDDVIRKQPGCSSRFQSYTAVAAGYAVAMVAEQALDMLDNSVSAPRVVSWVRGQQYLDKQWPGLMHRDWVTPTLSQDSWIQIRSFP